MSEASKAQAKVKASSSLLKLFLSAWDDLDPAKKAAPKLFMHRIPIKNSISFFLTLSALSFFWRGQKKWCHIPSTIMGKWQPLLLPTLHSFHLSALWTLQISCFYPHTMAHTQRRRRSTSFLNTSSRKSFTGFFLSPQTKSHKNSA